MGKNEVESRKWNFSESSAFRQYGCIRLSCYRQPVSRAQDQLEVDGIRSRHAEHIFRSKKFEINWFKHSQNLIVISIVLVKIPDRLLVAYQVAETLKVILFRIALHIARLVLDSRLLVWFELHGVSQRPWGDSGVLLLCVLPSLVISEGGERFARGWVGLIEVARVARLIVAAVSQFLFVGRRPNLASRLVETRLGTFHGPVSTLKELLQTLSLLVTPFVCFLFWLEVTPFLFVFEIRIVHLVEVLVFCVETNWLLLWLGLSWACWALCGGFF